MTKRPHTNAKKYYQHCAEAIWDQMEITWPLEKTNENSVMYRLRAMLDLLEKDMFAIRPEDLDELEGVVVTENEMESSEREDVDVLAGDVEGDSSKDDVVLSDQKGKESQSLLLKSDARPLVRSPSNESILKVLPFFKSNKNSNSPT